MTIKEILNESFYIEMSLSNLNIQNESVASIAAGAVAAVVRMIDKFVAWIRNTVIPFFQRIGKIIADLLRKTKLGRKLLKKHDDKVAAAEAEARRKELEEEEEDRVIDEKLAKLYKKILANPRWLNYIAHSIINPNSVLKLARSTEDREADIQAMSNKIDQHINDGMKYKTVIGFTEIMAESREQLEILQKSTMTFETNANDIIKACNEIKRDLANAKDKGSAMMVKNTSSVLQMITKKMAEVLTISAENIKYLSDVVNLKPGAGKGK